MNYLYHINKWLIIVNIILFLIPSFGLMFLTILGSAQVTMAIIIACNFLKLNKSGKTQFIIYSIVTVIVLFTLYCIANIFTNNHPFLFIVCLIVSILLAFLHLNITYLLYKIEKGVKTSNIFMSGNWEDLIVTTFEVNKSCIKPYLPKNTEPDLYNGKALMSMVAFTFSKVKFFGIKIPMHQHFGQINFRFYVKSKIDGTKGVVFIKEFAPKPLIAMTANVFYNEPYFYKPITLKKIVKNNKIKLEYRYKGANICAISNIQTYKLTQNTLEGFVVDRNIAFVKNRYNKTFKYKICHKPWELYEVHQSYFDNKILKLLPSKFKNIKHVSTCFVNGSSIQVQKGILQ